MLSTQPKFNTNHEATETQNTAEDSITHDFTRFSSIGSGRKIDRTQSSPNYRYDRIIGMITPVLPPNVQDRVKDASYRAKYLISNSLPSGSGFLQPFSITIKKS